MIKCPDCSHENDDGAIICEACGYLLIDPTVSTKQYDNTDYQKGVPRWGSASFKGRTNLLLNVVDSHHSFVYNYDEIETITIGRNDPKKKNPKFLDLTVVGGLEAGVSREHAFIKRQGGKLFIEDNGSANGTFLNGQMLAPNEPRVMRDGDEVRLGYLTVRVTFAPIE
ncbi:MAG: FHA domain-containing protein [Chloroflexota bacterium]